MMKFEIALCRPWIGSYQCLIPGGGWHMLYLMTEVCW